MTQPIESTLRAMARNYANGHAWDHLDGEAVSQAADELQRLRQEVSDLTVSGHQEYMRCEKMRGQLGEALDENKRLAQLAYVGEHQHEDHTYKARLSELRLQAGGMQMEIDELQALLEEVLNEVPHGWGASFSDSDLAQRIRAQLKQGEDDE